MKTIEQIPAMDADTAALFESMSTGQPLDPRIRDRIRNEGRKLTEELRQALGIQRISADLIREGRDE